MRLPNREQVNGFMRTWKDELKEWGLALIIGVALIVFIRSFVVTTYHIEGDSMLPTLHSKDQVVVSLVTPINRGDLVILKNRDDQEIVKRVVGIPTDTIEFKNNQLLINGERLVESYIYEQDYEVDDFQVELDDQSYFVLGDNRKRSLDSRVLGVFTKDDIVGEVKLVYYPVSHLSWLHY